ncbi:MAG: hypothetical protein RLZZ298_2582 [Pseudomonadota bacterium]|jgi:hypothetical protein
MTSPHIHVLLVSAQAAPNLLPALDPALKPKEAILLVTKKMATRATALENVLREASVKVTRVALDDEHDFSALEKILLDLAANRDGEDIALNVTGGTKLMALAAQSVAQAAAWRVFYVDVDTDEVIWLGKETHRKKLAAQLRLPHYLRGYGFRLEEGIERPAADHRHNELLQTLVSQVGSLEAALGQLNYLVQLAEDNKRLNIDLNAEQQDSRSLEALLRNFETAGVLSVKGHKIQFASEQDRSFTKGGWLEHHTYRTISALHGELGIRDKAANLVVVDESGVKNELDIAFLAKNRLFIVECKTARMDSARAGKANDTLFKLSEICRRVGGLGTRGMLASYRQLGDAEKKLAKALNIEVVTGIELNRLDEKLKRWVKA